MRRDIESLDINLLRLQTPGCQHVLHFNNAGASLMPQPVIDAVNQHFAREIKWGGYEAAAMAYSKVKNFYNAASVLIGCQPHEVAFMENATRAWDMFFYSLDFQPGDRILTAVAEYASNYIAFLQMAKRRGVIIDVIPNDSTGQLSLDALKDAIDSKVKLIAITHVPTQGGLINPAEEVGVIAKEAGIFYLLDATQSIGQMPVLVSKIQCSALCATGRKYLRGPRGTGFLYVKQEILEALDPPFLDLHAAQWISKDEYLINPDASRFETWEVNYANKIGLGVAIDYALNLGLENIWERVSYLGDLLRIRISKFPEVKVADLGKHKCGIVTFTLKGYDAQEVMLRLRSMRINVSVSVAEYARLDMEQRGLSSLVRASVHYFNTEEEIDLFCAAIKEILKD